MAAFYSGSTHPSTGVHGVTELILSQPTLFTSTYGHPVHTITHPSVTIDEDDLLGIRVTNPSGSTTFFTATDWDDGTSQRAGFAFVPFEFHGRGIYSHSFDDVGNYDVRTVAFVDHAVEVHTTPVTVSAGNGSVDLTRTTIPTVGSYPAQPLLPFVEDIPWTDIDEF